MQVGRIISAPVQKVGNAVSKMGKVTKAAVLATAVGAATVYGGTTNNFSQVSANNTNNAGGIVGYAQTSDTTSNISNSTNASLENNTTKAVGGVGGFTPWIYTDEVGKSNKTVRVENDKLEYVFHTNIPASHLKVLGSKTLEAETRDFQEVGTITESKTSHTDPKYGPVYEYKVEYPVGYHFGMINANNVATNCVDGSKGIVTHIPEFKK